MSRTQCLCLNHVSTMCLPLYLVISLDIELTARLGDLKLDMNANFSLFLGCLIELLTLRNESFGFRGFAGMFKKALEIVLSSTI